MIARVMMTMAVMTSIKVRKARAPDESY